jgi:hypothetical protein
VSEPESTGAVEPRLRYSVRCDLSKCLFGDSATARCVMRLPDGSVYFCPYATVEMVKKV